MSEKAKSPFLTIFKKDGKHLVDTGHADVGPFDTRDEAKAHIRQILDAGKAHNPRNAEQDLKAFIEEINSDFFIEFLNAHMPHSLFSLEQRTHHHNFSEATEQPEEGMLYFACSCGDKNVYIEDED